MYYIPYIGDHNCTLGDEVAFIDVILGGNVRNAHGCDRVPAEDFLDEGVDIGQILAVVKQSDR